MTIKGTDIVTVIIPVHNAERTIFRCIESIIMQSYTNLQILVINDGSTDGTADILCELQQRDSRIHVINQENKGPSAARNAGLDNVHGQWFTFVDADDYIELKLYEKMLQVAHKSQADIVSCAIKEVYTEKEVAVRPNQELASMTGQSALKNMFHYQGIRTVLWDKLYRAEKFLHIRLDEDIWIGEDTLFNYYAFKICKQYTTTAYIGYTYNHMESRLTGKIWGTHSLDSTRSAEKIYRDSLRKDYYEDAKKFYFCILHHVLRGIILYGDYQRKDKEDYQWLKERAIQFSLNYAIKHLTKANFVQWLLYIYWPKCYRFIHMLNHRELFLGNSYI